MNFKRSIMLLILVLFIGVVSINTVYAEDNIDNNAKTLDETVLNDKLSNIKFIDEKAIVMGSIADNLTVSNLLVNVSSEFRDEYNVDSINVMDGEKVLELNDIVVSDMVLLITLNDSTTYSYVIKVVGDLNNDGIVNDDDVNVMIDGILTPKSEEETSQDEVALEENKEEQIINDVNEDSNVDVLDVTQTTYSINKGNWGIGQVELEDIVSSLDAPDVVYVDDTVEVIYKITGMDAGIFKGVYGTLNYDKELLELDSVFVSCMYGYLNEDGTFLYVFDDSSEEVLITFSFRVTSRGEGSTDITLDDLKAAVDGVSVELDAETLSKGIQIEEYGKGGDVSSEEETTETPVPVETTSAPVATTTVYSYSPNYTTSYVSLSSNNYIRSLEIKNQKIDFDKDIMEYSITVGNKVNSLDMTIVLDDEKASYEVIGNDNFKTGKNVVTIKVTAEDGSVRNYIINVIKKGESSVKEKDNNNISKYVIIGLIVLIIGGLVYIIFKDDDDEDEKSSKK